VQALEDSGILASIRRFAGSSAGAICAGLLAVGCTAQEIADVFKCDIKWLFHGMRYTIRYDTILRTAPVCVLVVLEVLMAVVQSI